MDVLMAVAEMKVEIHGERMPNVTDNLVTLPSGKVVAVIQMPANMITTYQQLYEVCCEEAERTNPGIDMPKYNAFYNNFKKNRPDVKLRKFGKFTKCSLCAFIREMITLCGQKGKARLHWQNIMKQHIGEFMF